MDNPVVNFKDVTGTVIISQEGIHANRFDRCCDKTVIYFGVKIPRKKIPKGMEPEAIQKFISVNIQTIIRFSIQRDATDYFIRFECIISARLK